jgi:molybdopterin converting factor small subunit
MPSDQMFDPGIVQKLIKAAKDEPVSFAFGSAGGDKTVLAVDKLKAPGQLLLAAKKESGGKACCGTVAGSGMEATFVCDSPLPGMKKMLDEWFRRNKISMKAVVVGEQAEEAKQADEVKRAESIKPVEREAKKADADSKQADSKEVGRDEKKAEADEEEEASSQLFDPEMIRRRLRIAKDKPMNFAFGMGKDGPNLLALHPRREGQQLAMIIKRENGATRGTFGSVNVDATVAEFHCEKTPVPGLKKMLRAMFKEWKLALRIKIFGPEGEFVEAGDEDDEVADGAPEAKADAETKAEQPARPQADQAVAALRAELEALFPKLKPIVDADATRGAEIRATYKDCDTSLKAGDAGKAQDALEQLRRLAAAGTAGAEAEKLREARDNLLPALKELAKNAEVGANIQALWHDSVAALKDGNLVAAGAAIESLRMIAEGGAPGPQDAGLLAERLEAIKENVFINRATRELGGKLREAEAAVRDGRADAGKLLDDLETEIARIASARRRQEAERTSQQAKVGKVGVVAFAQMRLRWNEARSAFDQAQANVVEGLAKMMQTEEFADDPRASEPETSAQIKALAERLPGLDDLSAALDQALDSISESPENRPARIREADRAVDAYLTQLAAFETMKQFETSDAGNFPTISLIESALADLKAAFATAV